MSPTRRDLFTLAAGLGLAGAVPTVAERIAAHEILSQPSAEASIHDPATMANATHGHLAGWWDGWLEHISPEEHVTERRALDAFKREWPGIAEGGLNTFWTYQEAVYALAINLYHVGLRHGAAYEHLRRSVVGEIATCATCWGVGINKQGATCATCGGTGLVTHQA